jgi:hypothetical protein
MIIEQNVTLVVSVCRLEESGRPKCHKYWPEGDSESDPTFKNLLRKGYKLKLLEEKPLGKTLIARDFELTSELDGGKLHKIT